MSTFFEKIKIHDSAKVEHIDKICEAFDCQVSNLIEYVPNNKKAKSEKK